MTPAWCLLAALLSPLQTVQTMHDALREADRAKAESVLHAEYRGVSLQGPVTDKHVFVETRRRAVETVAALHHCGYESYVLFRTARGWEIVAFADTDTPLRGRSRAAVCPD
jgi:hypothetical protein